MRCILKKHPSPRISKGKALLLEGDGDTKPGSTSTEPDTAKPTTRSVRRLKDALGSLSNHERRSRKKAAASDADDLCLLEWGERSMDFDSPALLGSPLHEFDSIRDVMAAK